jgi:hypothetical protein
LRSVSLAPPPRRRTSLSCAARALPACIAPGFAVHFSHLHFVDVRRSKSPTSDLDELESSEERLPNSSPSPTSVRLSGNKQQHGSKSPNNKSPNNGGRRQAAKLVDAMVKNHKEKSSTRPGTADPARRGAGGSGSNDPDPATPSVFETGNPHTHHDEFLERKRHPHRPNLRTNWEYAHTTSSGGGDASGRDPAARTRSPSGSPKGASTGTSPLFTAIRENAKALKDEQRRQRELQRRRKDEFHTAPAPV